MATRRARSDEDKLARRSQILDAARVVFDAGEVDEFTMEAVAAALDLAKGTLYRYFPTREGLLLALADDEYRQFYDRVDAALATPPAAERVGAMAGALVDQILAEPRFLRLAALVPSVLERNIPFETAMEYKSNVIARARRTSKLVAAWLQISEARAGQMLFHLQAISTGLYHAANPAPIIIRVQSDPRYPGRRPDLRSELLDAALALVQAASSR